MPGPDFQELIPQGDAQSLPSECCANCLFFLAVQPGHNYCRRLPPVPFVVSVNWNLEKTQVVSNVQISTQAITNPAAWCGEYQKNKEKMN